MVDDSLIPVSTSELSISRCRKHLESSFSTNFKNGHIKSSTSKIKYYDFFIRLFSFSISKCSSSRFIDDSFYLESCNFSSCFCCVSLRVIKVSRYSNYCLRNSFSKEFFSIWLQFLEDERRNLFRFIFFSVYNDKYSPIRSFFGIVGYVFEFRSNFIVFSTDPSFYFVDYIFWFKDSLSLCEVSHKEFISLDIDDRRSSSISFCVCDNFGLVSEHIWHTGICGSKVNSDNLCHFRLIL